MSDFEKHVRELDDAMPEDAGDMKFSEFLESDEDWVIRFHQIESSEGRSTAQEILDEVFRRRRVRHEQELPDNY